MMGDERPPSEAQLRDWANSLRWMYDHADDVSGVAEYLADLEDGLHLTEYVCCVRDTFEAPGSTPADLARYMDALDALGDWEDDHAD